jgi:hypothetical protein
MWRSWAALTLLSVLGMAFPADAVNGAYCGNVGAALCDADVATNNNVLVLNAKLDYLITVAVNGTTPLPTFPPLFYASGAHPAFDFRPATDLALVCLSALLAAISA